MSRSKPRTGSRPAGGGLSLDAVHELLSARRRRYLLYYLYLYEDPVSLATVADRVAEWERNESPLPEDRTRAYTDLHHAHVPKLAAATVVARIPDDDAVALGENAAQLRPYLEQSVETDLAAAGIRRL